MHRYILLLIPLLLALAGCLDKDPEYPAADRKEIVLVDTSRPTTISISGDWTSVMLRPLDSSPHIKVYDLRGNVLDHDTSAELQGEGYIEVDDDFRKFRITHRSKHELEITFHHLVAKEYEDYEIVVGGIFSAPYVIPLRLMRTHRFEIKDITFDLSSYVEYPDEDYEEQVVTMCYPDGYYPGESILFLGFSQVFQKYKFTLLSEDPGFIDLIGGETTYVAVPSYNDDPIYRWTMRGETTRFISRESYNDTKYFPEVPTKVEAPRGAPGDVTINCIYRKVVFNYILQCHNPATGTTDKIPGWLAIGMPIGFRGYFTPYE